MKTINKKLIISILSTLMAIVISVTVICSDVKAYAAINQNNFTTSKDFEFIPGASIRLDEPSGIRFTAKLNNFSLLDYNVSPYEFNGDELGMIIVPEKYLTGIWNGAEEKWACDVFGFFKDTYNKDKKDISTIFGGSNVDYNKLIFKDSKYIVNGVMVNIFEENYNLSYQAVVYHVKNGVTTYSFPSSPRTIKTVAVKALSDTNADFTQNERDALDFIVNKANVNNTNTENLNFAWCINNDKIVADSDALKKTTYELLPDNVLSCYAKQDENGEHSRLNVYFSRPVDVSEKAIKVVVNNVERTYYESVIPILTPQNKPAEYGENAEGLLEWQDAGENAVHEFSIRNEHIASKDFVYGICLDIRGTHSDLHYTVKKVEHVKNNSAVNYSASIINKNVVNYRVGETVTTSVFSSENGLLKVETDKNVTPYIGCGICLYFNKPIKVETISKIIVNIRTDNKTNFALVRPIFSAKGDELITRDITANGSFINTDMPDNFTAAYLSNESIKSQNYIYGVFIDVRATYTARLTYFADIYYTLDSTYNNEVQYQGEPQYNENKEMLISGYWAPKPTAEQFQWIKDAGFTHIYLEGKYGEHGTENYIKALELAEQAGIKVIAQRYRKDLPMFADPTDYSKYPSFDGFNCWDEPVKADIDNYIVNDLVEFNEKYSGRNDVNFYSNLFPHYVSPSRTGFSDFYDYVDYFGKNVSAKIGGGKKIISLDSYPLCREYNTDYLMPGHLTSLEALAVTSAKYGLVPYNFIQAMSFGQKHRAPTQKDFDFQAYTSFAFGMKGIQYFTYRTPNEAPGGEFDRDSYGNLQLGLIDRNDVRTESWYSVKNLNAEINRLKNVYLSFSWKGVITVDGQTYHNTNDFEQLRYKLSGSERIYKITASSDTVVGCFKDGNGYDGFLITPYVDPSLNKTTEVSVSFGNADMALVYVNGYKNVKQLVNGRLDITVNPGEGIFVIPYNK